ncbi:unnamed protein product [Tetraodon nigroviridis]|uniref:Chromosome 4 SCAF14752, whole genome shotgun sequence n=1 Tax=Tetraodon nigroviridis TaxID=99883 RepID=Q4S386_TETNG|nr:unnamed protein product [Tetraodon nigroviridis]
MFLSRWGPAALALLHRVEPTVVLQQLSSTFFDTALLMVVKERSANASYPDLSRGDSQQKAMSDFYMVYNLIVKLVPILPALLLARLGDRGWRRAPIVVSLSGYLLQSGKRDPAGGGQHPAARAQPPPGCRPAEEPDRSAGGGVPPAPSHLPRCSCQVQQGERAASAAGGHVLRRGGLRSCGHPGRVCGEGASQLERRSGEAVSPRLRPGEPASVVDVCPLPLQVGYGNAAGCMIFLTSFLGLLLFRRCMNDVALILLGMISFATGIFFMTFVTTTTTFYLGRKTWNRVPGSLRRTRCCGSQSVGVVIATELSDHPNLNTCLLFPAVRSLNLFALIPMPTIRSLLSKQVPSSSCGFVFMLSSVLTVVGMIPVRCARLPASANISNEVAPLEAD